MGILDFFMGIQDPVAAEYRVTRVSKAPTTSSVGVCDLVGELTVAGGRPQLIEHTSALAPTAKWPRVGDVIPVLADRDNPEFMKIEWKALPERTA